MQFVEAAITQNMKELLSEMEFISSSFYLGGGTGLALQFGHRQSDDLDFFTTEEFNPDHIMEKLRADTVTTIESNSLHCVKNGVPLSFIRYTVPLVYEPILWQGARIADNRDLIAEKFKTVAQRGAKKDFCDIYAASKLNSIPECAKYFLERFQKTALDPYAVLKGLTYFIDADHDPDPVWLDVPYSTDWDEIKGFFTEHIHRFHTVLVDFL